MDRTVTLDQLTERIRQTLDRSGVIPGDWSETDQLARTIAIDIDREESADVQVLTGANGTKIVGPLDGISVYIIRDEDGDEQLSLPVDYDGDWPRERLPELLAILNHIERTGI